MTDRPALRRRTLLGTVLAAGVGTLGSASGQYPDDTGREGSVAPANQDIEQYANRVGRIASEGLDEAFVDWSNGNITRAQLDQVIDAWSNGERVVEDGIYVVTIDSNITEDTVLEREPPGMPAGDQVVYQMQSEIGVSAQLEIEAGVAIEFQQQAGMDVKNGGTLIGNGTENETILMTATLAKRGWWNSVIVRTEDLQNSLSHTIVEYGGRDGGCVDVGSGSDAGLLELSNCTLRRSGTYGLVLDENSSLGGDSGENTYTNNRQAAAYAETDNVHTLSGDSTYTGNDRDYVLVKQRNVNGEGADETQYTWESLGVPYRMQPGEHTINSLELIIEPGAFFEFNEGAQFSVQNGARASWSGVTDEGEPDPIVFTGSETQRGWWDGIKIETADDNNLLEQVIVEYGGDGLSGNVEIGSTGIAGSYYVEIRDCLFRRSAGYGMYVVRDTELDCENNEYTDNADGPVRIETDNMQMLSSTSMFTGNDNDYVFVAQRNVNGDGPDQTQYTWSTIDVPYRMESDTHQLNNIELTIDPGTVIEFTDGAQLLVQNGTRINWSGVLDDGGVAPIIFGGTEYERGWWSGIKIETQDSNNLMEEVIVESAGDGLSGNVEIGSSGIAGSYYVEIRDCWFRKSAGYGMYVVRDTELDCENNEYTDNADGPVRIETDNMHMLSDTSTFTGNDNDYVFVSQRNVNGDGPGQTQYTWDALDVPYRMQSDEHQIKSAQITVDPGTAIECAEGASFSFQSNSRVIMSGTQENQITVRATDAGQDIQGWWEGILVISDSVLNEMSNVVVENGGKDPSNSPEGNVHVTNDGALVLEDSALNESAGAGVYVESNGTINDDVCTANTFADNAGGDCVVEN